MKKCIVFLMTAILAITTVPTPIWANENCENSIAITENAEKDIQDTVTDPRLNYIYVEQPYLESPDTQKIAVSWGDGTENITEMSAVVSGPEGEEIWYASEETDTIYLFERAYTEQEKGIYQITELNLAIQGVTYTYSLAELGAETVFGVDEEYEGIEQLSLVDDEGISTDIAAYNIDEAGNVTEKESLEEAINQATAEIPAMMCDDGVQTQNTNLVVALDPGHDSSHAGASANGVREEVLTLKIAQYCKAELENYAGVSVYMTRTSAACPHPGGSSAKDIEQRVADAAKAGASIYVSIHLNSSKSSSAKGAEVIYPNSSWKPQVGADGKRLAELIEDELVGIGLERRAIYSKNTTIGETYEDGSISDYFTVQISAKEHGIPGIIVEHAFVTNSSDVNNYLNNEAGLKKLGVADATGIAKYFGLEKEGWQKDSKGWWYQSGSGYLKNQWALINGKWYYFDSDGYMRTGWQKISGSWYYFGDRNDGSMKTGWYVIDGKKYYFDQSSGIMQTGWKQIEGAWYYFDDNGVYDASKKYTDITDNNSTTNNGVNSSTKKDEENIESKVVEGTYLIEGTTSVSVKQMTDYFRQSKYSYPTDIMKKGGASTLEEFCQIYYEEAEKEGIKAEVAFAQAMKETGWLQFKGDVKAEQYNFAGMGATGNSVAGESFKDVREGVRAQIQHLKAYGSTKDLNQTCVDNRFKYVERGCSIYVEWLGIPNNPKNKGWAAADGYGVDIVKMVQKMKSL